MKRQAASFFSDALVMQYASEWRMPAGWLSRGSAATSQSKSVIVRNVGVERREESTIACGRSENASRRPRTSISSSLGTTRYGAAQSPKNSDKRVLRLRRVEREVGGIVLVVDELAAVRPHERRDADQRWPRRRARRLDSAVAVLVASSASLPSRPSRSNSSRSSGRSPRPPEQIAVVVDDEAGDVLRKTDELAVEAERVEAFS